MTKLSEAEWIIMELLWEKGSLTTMELSRELEKKTGWTKSTVITRLKRMLNKGTIYFRDDGKSKMYYPNINKGEAEVEESRSFLNRFFNGNLSVMVNNLIQEEAISQEELDELYRLLREKQ